MFDWLFGQYNDYPPVFLVLELAAVICGVASVLLVKRGNILSYPIGLISTSLFVYLLWQWQLFGDMFINFYYSLMGIYGWINWSKHTNQGCVQVSRINRRDYGVAFVLVNLSFAFVGMVYYLKPWINNRFVWDGVTLGFGHLTGLDYVDMLTTGLFLVAMWLMAQRKIEHWLVWIIADAMSVGLYFAKGLVFTAVQYVVFTLIAIFAYFSWRRLWRQQQA